MFFFKIMRLRPETESQNSAGVTNCDIMKCEDPLYSFCLTISISSVFHGPPGCPGSNGSELPTDPKIPMVIKTYNILMLTS